MITYSEYDKKYTIKMKTVKNSFETSGGKKVSAADGKIVTVMETNK